MGLAAGKYKTVLSSPPQERWFVEAPRLIRVSSNILHQSDVCHPHASAILATPKGQHARS